MSCSVLSSSSGWNNRERGHAPLWASLWQAVPTRKFLLMMAYLLGCLVISSCVKHTVYELFLEKVWGLKIYFLLEIILLASAKYSWTLTVLILQAPKSNVSSYSSFFFFLAYFILQYCWLTMFRWTAKGLSHTYASIHSSPNYPPIQAAT